MKKQDICVNLLVQSLLNDTGTICLQFILFDVWHIFVNIFIILLCEDVLFELANTTGDIWQAQVYNLDISDYRILIGNYSTFTVIKSCV